MQKLITTTKSWVWTPLLHHSIHNQQKASFTWTPILHSKRSQLRKPNYSSLTKHMKPDGLTGRQRRDVLRSKLNDRTTGARHVPYIPVKNRLETIPSTLSKKLPESFDDLGLQEQTQLVQAIRSILPDQAKPTEIQALTIPTILSTKDARHILCAAETGSGKTLAYLVPTIHGLKQTENKRKRRLDRPRAIVLVPTRELVSQVVQTCKSLAHSVKFRSLGLDGKTPRHRLVKDLEYPVDVLITTPTTLRKYVKDHTFSLTDVQFLIVDEADSLFDAGWGDDVQSIMKKIPQETSKTIVVSATLPRSVHRTLDELFGQDNMLKITTPSLHRALPNLKQSFIDLQRFNGNRQLALLDVLKKNIKDEKTLVFCNTKHSTELLQQWLASKEVDVLVLHKDVDRKQTMGLFSGEIELKEEEEEEKSKKNYNVLISTDIASRGIDTTFVDHVVLYDFPASMIDYLHRVGRTARAGRTGKATSLIGRKDRMIADRIKRSIREGAVIT
ncbi:hypothetical protein INT45_005513 [Circinella minor]|uniref:RNA helicase n=1 Tax=Circinella minor TaxID=1195481 RepID=A0A8H7RSF0_9FUNG|nr:hypothetical protein INT45_005513 [Circinella minor]